MDPVTVKPWDWIELGMVWFCCLLPNQDAGLIASAAIRAISGLSL
jgi:hypothetical protein